MVLFQFSGQRCLVRASSPAPEGKEVAGGRDDFDPHEDGGREKHVLRDG